MLAWWPPSSLSDEGNVALCVLTVALAVIMVAKIAISLHLNSTSALRTPIRGVSTGISTKRCTCLCRVFPYQPGTVW